MATLPNNTRFPTANQVPDHSIMDLFGKQCYLGNAFTLSNAELSLPTTAETNLVYISNPGTSKKSLFINLRRVSSSLQPVDIRYYLNPTITVNGSAATPLNLRPANSNVSVSSCFTSPTSSAFGTLIETLGCPQSYYVVSDSSLLFILDPGNSMLMTGSAQTATTNINSDISWYEL